MVRLYAGKLAPLWGALVATVALLALTAGGCTSETQNLVGTSLITSQVDTVLQPLPVRDISAYAHFAAVDDEEPFAEAQVLYFGRQGSESSSILLNYDFSTLVADGWGPDVINADNISAVKLVMIRLEHYSKLPSESRGDFHNPGEKSYEVYQLEQPFTEADYPGPLPSSDPIRLNTDPQPRSTGGVTLQLDIGRFLAWYTAADSVGVMVTEGVHPDSDDGFVGYGSRDMTRFSELPPEWEGTVVPPKLQIEFADTTSNLIIAPYADISSFDQLDPAPDDLGQGFMLRTHMRDYPWLLFDFSQLPNDAFINRAVLLVANDTTRAYGPGFEAIVVSELDSTFTADADTVTTAWLGNNVYEINARLSLKPWETTQLDLNVTAAVQRLVNEVYPGRRGFLLAAGESEFASVGNAGFDPGLLLQRFWFYGDDAPADSLRPQLQITYTRTDPLPGGERQ